jgi:hypothetical protein
MPVRDKITPFRNPINIVVMVTDDNGGRNFGKTALPPKKNISE